MLRPVHSFMISRYFVHCLSPFSRALPSQPYPFLCAITSTSSTALWESAMLSPVHSCGLSLALPPLSSGTLPCSALSILQGKERNKEGEKGGGGRGKGGGGGEEERGGGERRGALDRWLGLSRSGESKGGEESNGKLPQNAGCQENQDPTPGSPMLGTSVELFVYNQAWLWKDEQTLMMDETPLESEDQVQHQQQKYHEVR
ncbi:hypothetical protein PoB_006177600 [Plakobranchus ocellatus]|uniref:Uncharacterized protein n=1 Tax=Plakobranchus ocellatus TaxID=259542 RepID=A0AAV4CTT0_9GAST|nr:hypothetical protein PoB_006177600 [Plakobranchus ocellatus]